MGEEFKQVGKQFEEHIKEMKTRMITEESKLKQDVEVHKIKID